VDHGEAGGVDIPLALAEIAAGWPLAASIAAATVGGLRAGRRRTALNEALHELRRPLQALALTTPPGRGVEPTLESSLQLAVAALERLEREVNGEAARPRVAPLRARPLLEAAVARWRGRAVRSGGSLELRWEAGEPTLRGDRCALAQALDNLIVNAIEHGGARISVEASGSGGALRIVVCDSGRRAQPARGTLAEAIARLAGRRRRGHGLRLVRRTAVAHGGRFELRCAETGTAAALELPLLAAESVA
jgi:signal transduction histidine kinase